MDEGLQEFFQKELDGLVAQARKEAFDEVLTAIAISLSSKKAALEITTSDTERFSLKAQITLLENFEVWIRGLASE